MTREGADRVRRFLLLAIAAVYPLTSITAFLTLRRSLRREPGERRARHR